MELAKKRTLSKIAFACSLGAITAIASLYFYNIVRWGKTIDRGFFVRTSSGVKVVGVVTEAGRQAGLQLGDHILKLNGRTFKDMRELRSFLNQQPGEMNIYLIQRKGQQFEVTIPFTPVGINESFIRSGFPFLVGLFYVLTGILIFLMKPHRRTTWIFFIFSAIVGLLLSFLLKVGQLEPYWLGTVHIFLYTFAPATIIHLAMSFPEERSLLKDHPKVQFLPYLGSTLLFICIRSAVSEITDIPKIWFLILIVYLVFALVIFLLSCFQSLLRSPSEIVKLRSKMILLGAAISAFVYISDQVLNALFHVYLIPSFNYHLPFFIVFPLFVGYSIIKHNLFDIDATIRRTFGYIFTTIAIAGVYTLSVFIPHFIFGSERFVQSPVFPIIFTLAVIFFFNLSRGRVQKFVDRVFYRLEYDYQDTVEKISETMRSLLSLDQIAKNMMEIVLGVLFIEKGSIMLLNQEEHHYESIAGSPSKYQLPAQDPLIQKMAERKKEVTLYDIEEDPLFKKEREACKSTFEQMEATLIVPLFYEDRLIGLMSLGEKKSGKFYRREDINLLKTLANQGALAIENVRLHQARIDALEHSRKELDRLNRAKGIALDHLSHELRTPLSVIQGNIRLLKRRLEREPSRASGEESFETLETQLKRLMDIQQETDKIIRSYQKFEKEPIFLFPFTERILEKVKQTAAHRNLDFRLDEAKDLCALAPPKILEEILEGLLKNAIENTPDEGMIRVILEQKAQWLMLKVMDFGIGITEENQRHIFEGLFHTQVTELYSSKKPYDFYAGGKGLDLLRIKVHGDRFGLDISVASQRCIYIPTDQDICPGRISTCPHCKTRQDCINSGGSTFCVSFPVAK